jgi:hypothetical protein
VQAVFDVDSEVVDSLKFARRHEFDAHDFVRVQDRFLELEITRFGHDCISQGPQLFCDICGLLAKRNRIEKKVEIPRCSGLGKNKLQRLTAHQDEVARGGSQRCKQLQKVRFLRFGNHAAFHIGSIAFSNR